MRHLPLVLIILLGIFLRFWQLDVVPPDIHGDEADMGYSAYSILHTGVSQFGTFNPLAIQEAFIGSRPPLYIYSLIPLIKAFGLSLYVQRLPSAIYGVLSIIVFALILKKLFHDKTITIIGTLLFTLNPWALHMARQGLLESIAIFFVTAGILCFLYAEKKKMWWSILSAILLGLSLFAYDAPKIFLPPFLFALLLYRRDLWAIGKRWLIGFVCIIGIFYLLMLKVVIFDGQIKDYTTVSFVDKNRVIEAVNRERQQTRAPLWASSLFHNKATVIIKQFEESYTAIFSFNWFFINGHGNLQQSVAKHGQYFLFELPFFFIGMYLVFRKHKALGCLLLAWIFSGALPGGVTSGNYPYRSVLLLPVPIIFSAVGIAWFWQLLQHKMIAARVVMRSGFVVICAIYVVSYLFTYFFDYPVYAAEYWAKPVNDSLRYAIAHQDKYEHVFVDGRWESNYAFIQRLDPKEYQYAYANQITMHGVTVMKVGKFYFGNFGDVISTAENPIDLFPPRALLITHGVYFPKVTPVTSLLDPSGERAVFNIFSIE